jgi:hypothetical protein
MMTNSRTNWRQLLLMVTLTELILGGGGRLLEMGPMTLRMLLFGLTQLVIWTDIARGTFKASSWHWTLLGSLAAVSAFSAFIGWNNGSDFKAIFTDIKPLLYWANLLFFASQLSDYSHLQAIKKYMRWGTALLTVAYLVLLILWKSNLIDGWQMYLRLGPTDEFSFRGNLGFFYKGFVFIPVGIFFWMQQAGKLKYVVIGLMYLAVLFTFTRGLWLLLFCFLAIYVLIYNRKSVLGWLSMAFMILSIYALGLFVAQLETQTFREQQASLDAYKAAYQAQELKPWQRDLSARFSQGFEGREPSISSRLIMFEEVAREVSLTSLFLGHGFGQGVPSKPIHMEMSFLEIFHKQGLPGLVVWGWLFWQLCIGFYRANGNSLVRVDYRSDAFVLFCASQFFFGISLINPFINSPLGLGMLSISLLGLRLLAKPAKLQHETD